MGKALRRLRIAHDGRKRLREFVGQRRRQLSHGRNSIQMVNFGPRPGSLQFRLLSLRDVEMHNQAAALLLRQLQGTYLDPSAN